MRLGDTTWTEIDELARESDASSDSDDSGRSGATTPILLLPVGSTEQHGPHLPIATDTLIAEEIVERAIHRTDGLMIGPTLGVTASGEHAGFPGTLSIGTAVMHDLALELGRSADWAAGIVFVNGHGGNHAPITSAVATLDSEGRRAMAWWARWPRRTDGGPADLHAGRIETSLMLAIDPGLVRLELAEPGVDAHLDELRDRGVRAVAPTGVLGDPTGASGREGERFINGFVDDLVHEIERWRPIDPTE
jgi:creatinine amidohydrolase